MGKTVVITGGARGMGRAAALKLAGAGYFVYSLDIQQSGAEPDDPRNRNIRELPVDVCQQESIDKAYRQISAEVDRLDGILHFAGMILMDSLVEIPEEQFLKIFQVNLFGAYRINKTFLPLILASEPKGRILLTTSELALTRSSRSILSIPSQKKRWMPMPRGCEWNSDCLEYR